jgi:hypothetical protein
MNYEWHYTKLIETRKDRPREKTKYYEKHHILPRSMGGGNEISNLIFLTAREHFLAHWLLWKIHRNREMATAFFTMCFLRSSNQDRIKIGSRIYEEAKEARHAVGMSESSKRKCRDSRVPHEIRWRMSLPSEEAEQRIKAYHQSISDGVKNSIRNRSGMRYSEEGRKKLNRAKIGRQLSENHREKLREKSSRKGRNLKLIKCPHCEREGKGGNMTRYHFDNCKFVKHV